MEFAGWFDKVRSNGHGLIILLDLFWAIITTHQNETHPPSEGWNVYITIEPTEEPSLNYAEFGILLGNSNLTSGIFYGVYKDGDTWNILAREYVNALTWRK